MTLTSDIEATRSRAGDLRQILVDFLNSDMPKDELRHRFIKWESAEGDRFILTGDNAK